MSVKALQIGLSDSENGSRSPYDKVIFSSSPAIDIVSTCNSSQGPMFHTTSFPTSSTSSTSSTTTSSSFTYEHAPCTNTSRSDTNTSLDSKSQFDQQKQNDNDGGIPSSGRLVPSDLPKIVTHSPEFSKIRPQHQRVASDDSLVSLTALPSPATSHQDFPAAHHVKHVPPVRKTSSSSLNSDSKNYPHHLSHSENGDVKGNHTSDDGGPISSHHTMQQRLSKLGLTRKELIGHYAILQTIGEGAFSKVKLAVDLNRNKKVAIKMIPMKGIQDSERLKGSVFTEIELLKYIDHQNIVGLLDTVEIETHLCLVLEFVPGRELFDYVSDHYETSNEEESKYIFLQLVNIMEYLHGNNIVHRDLKLENILIDSKSSKGPVIKLTDFGLAKLIDESSPTLTTRCGSEEYAAPELLLAGSPYYDGRKTDLWSLGVILYALLVGYLPFNLKPGQTRKQFISKIVRVDFTFPNKEEVTGRKSTISNEAKDLVKKILTFNPHKRLILSEIKKHPWLKDVSV